MQSNIEITNKYSHEILDIANKLNQLEKGRIYELSGAQMDGYLSTNIKQLKEMITDLLIKIENGDDSIKDRLTKTLGEINI